MSGTKSWKSQGDFTGSRAKAALLRFARSGVRSRQDILKYLARKGLDRAQAADWIREGESLGLIDDRAAARLWAGTWARQNYADAAIRAKLLEKGFEHTHIDESIAALQSDTDDARARRALDGALRRVGSRRSPSRSGTRLQARLAGALASRGFDSELIERVLGASFDHSD